MSATSCWFIAGSIFLVPDTEVEAVEARKDPRVIRARRRGIATFLFTDPHGERPATLLIGSRIATLGLENDRHIGLTRDSMNDKLCEVEARMREAGFDEDVQLHAIWDQDY